MIGEAAAGHPFAGSVGPGQAVRIFTGAPVPAGADAIVIQENVARDGANITVRDGTPERGHIRDKGFDFAAGDALLEAGRRIGPRELSLAAAMGYGELPVRRRPRVAVLATGDELVPPGGSLGPGQIIASNHLGVAALAEANGARGASARHRPRHPREPRCPHRQSGRRRRDRHHRRRLGRRPRPGGAGAGGARHGAVVLEDRHAAGQAADVRPPRQMPACWACRAIRCRPSSARRVFLVPLIRALLGRPDRARACSRPAPPWPLEANGPRTHYMRATSKPGADGLPEVTPVRSQDSSLLAPLALADCLLVRPVNAPAAPAGSPVSILPLDF